MPGGNLLVMTDYTARFEFVRAFLASGMTQSEFCALHRERGGPSERTLRTWLAALTKPADFAPEARAIVARAVEDLQNLLQAFDAAQQMQVGGATEGDDAAGNALPAAVRCRPAERPVGAAGRRPAEGGHPNDAHGTLLDDLLTTMQPEQGAENTVKSEEPAAAAPGRPRRRSSFFSEFT